MAKSRKGRRPQKKSGSRRKLPTQKGGKFVGSGTYGCVYKENPLLCEGDKVPDTSIITKLLTKEESEKEYQIGELINSVYPGQTTILTPLARPCIPSNQQMKDNRLTDCKIPTFYDKETKMYKMNFMNKRIVKYKNGGEDLDGFTIASNIKELFNFLEGYLELMKGVYKLHERGLFHCDIKPGNTVALRIGDHRVIIRLIDLGFVQHITADYNPGEIFNSHYVYWPFSNHYLFDDSIPEKLLKEYDDDIQTHILMYIPEDIFYHRTGSNLTFNLTSENVLRTFSYVSKLETSKRYKLLLRASDMYGLGVTLARSLYTLNNRREEAFDDFYDIIRKLMNPDIERLVSLERCIGEYMVALSALKALR
jgi:serine/threonine protein kinase